MPRPSRDGEPSRAPRKLTLTELYVRKARGEAAAFNAWDKKAAGLVLRVQPSGHKAFKFVYSFRGRPRWYHIGDVGLADARRIAARLRLAVAEEKDPLADRQAERDSGTFAEVAQRYVAEHAKKHNKSWQQAEALVKRYVTPQWGKLDVKSILRRDVKQLVGKIEKPILANQVLAAVSAIFSWAIEQEVVALNPVKGVRRNKTQSRERVLGDAEVRLFWDAFTSAGLVRCMALRTILLTGQRPGEVAHMRREHVQGGWWELPGMPDARTGWPGTKNAQTHRVWLPQAVLQIIAEVSDGDAGFVFATERGKPVTNLDVAMREICASLKVEHKLTPHDLRRTHGTTITALGFGRAAMNRIQNHREGGIGSVYDRHAYADENRRIMEAVSSHLLTLAEGREETNNVVVLRR